MKLLQRVWSEIRAPLVFLWPIRLVVIPLALLLWVFIASDQGQDAVRAVVEFDPRCTRWGRVVLFIAMVMLLSLQAWYWARQLLRINFAAGRMIDLAEEHYRQGDTWLEVWTPRLLGLSAYLIAIGALIQAWQSYGMDGRYTHRVILVACALLALMAILFMTFVISRRLLLSRSPLAGPRQVASHSSLAPLTRTILISTLIMACAFLIWSIVSPLTAGAVFHTPAILVLSATLWIGIGSFIAYWADHLHVPLMALLLIVAILFSPINDNHAVRKLAGGAPPTRASVEASFDAWYRKLTAKYGSQRQPVFIVATEGGGIRAAYWTAAVLTTLQDHAPTFGDHLFAISGVSGGSLGATVFTALLADQERARVVDDCDTQLDPAAQKTTRFAAQQMLSYDFLAPTLVSMLFSDFVQRFLPVGFLPDRAKALETAWERGWSSHLRHADGSADEFFSSGFLQMYAAGDRLLPSLFLNGTSVERGKRIIASNCAIDSGGEVLDSSDLLMELGSDVRLSTAASNSARFTYVTPAATVRDARGKLRGHVVDGGYFENSGAATAADIVNTIMSKRNDHGWNIEPLVIFIQFGQVPPAAAPPQRFMNETLAPVRALMDTRDARGTLSVAQAERLNETRWGRFVLVQAGHGIRLPLGWLLARRSRNAIDLQVGPIVPPNIRPELRPYVERNVATLNQITSMLAPPTALRALRIAVDPVQQDAMASEASAAKK